MVGARLDRFLWDNITGRVEAYYVDAPTEALNTGGTTASGGAQNLILRAGLTFWLESLHF